MTPEQYQKLKELFQVAREMSPEERPAFLDSKCGHDRSLRQAVDQLLAEESKPRGAIDSGALGGGFKIGPPTAIVAEPPHAHVSRKIGRYHTKRVIAEGGMGTVYEAVQENPRRVVALKVMARGVTSRSALRRFEYESQILGRLRHPGIAQIYEAGVQNDDSGSVPYFAMEYIAGAKIITEYVNSKKLSTREQLELFVRVCEAVQHGHQKGIIHRDLKPSNILIDSSGQPKVIDFGVARATDSDLAITTLQTDVGQLIGTVQYMSPEQCAADPHDLDTRSDVYALGVLLYELLTGTLPYDVGSSTVLNATRMVQEAKPKRLSSVDARLRGDLETITSKALEKDRENRYQSAAELGNDIRRYLNNEAIVARPPTLGYQLRMFAKKNKSFCRAALAIVLVLVLGIIGTSIGLAQARLAAASARLAVDTGAGRRRPRRAGRTRPAPARRSPAPGLRPCR